MSPAAHVIGSVRIGTGCWIGPGAVLRADFGPIRIGPYTAIEENCVIHCKPGVECDIGEYVTIGHGTIVHAASICDYASVEMGAVIGVDAKLGRWCIVGEGSVVKSRQEVEPETVVAGIPAQVIGRLDEKRRAFWKNGKRLYVELVRMFAEGGAPHPRGWVRRCGSSRHPRVLGLPVSLVADEPAPGRVRGEPRQPDALLPGNRGAEPRALRKIARGLEEAGADAIHVSVSSTPENSPQEMVFNVPPMGQPHGTRVHLAEEIGKSVSVPVIAVGGIHYSPLAEEILASGRIHFIAVGRPLVAGGGFVGCETADFLASRGRKVTLEEQLPSSPPTWSRSGDASCWSA